MVTPRPTVPPPSLRYLERKRAEHRGAEAPKQEEMQREYSASPAPIKQPVPLDTAAFLAEGDNASWYNDLLSNPRDCCYAFCYPCPVCCPTRNLLCSLGFNLCCGWKVCNDVGWRFMWHPEVCPVACCTCCCPCTGLGEGKDEGVCDVACMCSKGPVARMHSFTYFAQWCGVAASEDAAPGCCAKHFRPEPIPKPWPQNLDPSIWPPQYNPASPCRSMKLFNCCCKIFPLPFGEEYRANPDWKPPYGGGFPHSFAKEFDPNGFASTVEALADFGTSTPCLWRCCVAYQQGCCGLFSGRTGFAPNTTYMPASNEVGASDQQMNDARDCGGYWAFPKAFTNYKGELIRGELPTPPKTRIKDKDGNECVPSTNVAPGAPGSKVIFWAHGSAWFAGQSADFLYFFGLFLSEQTGQTVLLGEYPLASEPRVCSKRGGAFFAEALNRWVSSYAKLVELYGAENVVVAGDSAGAGLAVGTLLSGCTHLDAPIPPPAGLLLISPFCELSDASWNPQCYESMPCNAPKNVDLRKAPQRFGEYDYLPYPNGYNYVPVIYASRAERETALASPALATHEQLKEVMSTGLKAFVTYGEFEILKDQANTALPREPEIEVIGSGKFSAVANLTNSDPATLLFKVGAQALPEAEGRSQVRRRRHARHHADAARPSRLHPPVPAEPVLWRRKRPEELPGVQGVV